MMLKETKKNFFFDAEISAENIRPQKKVVFLGFSSFSGIILNHAEKKTASKFHQN